MRERRHEIPQDAKRSQLSCYRPLEYDFDVNAPESISMNTFHCVHHSFAAPFRLVACVCVRECLHLTFQFCSIPPLPRSQRCSFASKKNANSYLLSVLLGPREERGSKQDAEEADISFLLLVSIGFICTIISFAFAFVKLTSVQPAKYFCNLFSQK